MIVGRIPWIALPLAAIAGIATLTGATRESAPVPVMPPDREEPVYDLILADAGHRLDLRLQGFLLRSFEVSRARLETPRVLFVPLPPPRSESLGGLWNGARLSPAHSTERVEIDPDVSEEDLTLPPLPEELPAPGRFAIRFERGGSLEIVAAEPAGRLRRIGARLTEAGAAVLRCLSGRPRLRLEMPATDAAALYRSLPPEVRFGILPAPAKDRNAAALRP